MRSAQLNRRGQRGKGRELCRSVAWLASRSCWTGFCMWAILWVLHLVSKSCQQQMLQRKGQET